MSLILLFHPLPVFCNTSQCISTEVANVIIGTLTATKNTNRLIFHVIDGMFSASVWLRMNIGNKAFFVLHTNNVFHISDRYNASQQYI